MIQKAKNKKLKPRHKDIIFFIAMHFLGIITIYSSFSDWQLQQILNKEGIETEATIKECSFVRSGSCWVTYEYEATLINGMKKWYTVKEGTGCVYCEGLSTMTVLYLPQNPEMVAIKGERNIMFVFGIIFVIGAWVMIIVGVVDDRNKNTVQNIE